MATHTLTPWEMVSTDAEYLGERCFNIADKDLRDVAFELKESDAAHIVHCVNHHDELFHALEHLVMVSTWLEDQQQEALTKARAILEKVKES